MAKESPWSPVFTTHYDPLKAGSIDSTDTEPHDHAVLTAMNAKYKANKTLDTDPNHTLFFGRLNLSTTEAELEDAFSQFGKITYIKVVRDIVTGFSKGYGFVEFADGSSVRNAYRNAYNLRIDDHCVLVDYEHERIMKGWVPRRLGGGLSGKRESGQLRFGGRDRPFRKPIVLKTPTQVQDSDSKHSTPEHKQNIKQEKEEDSHRKRYDHRRSRERDSDKYRSSEHRRRKSAERYSSRDKEDRYSRSSHRSQRSSDRSHRKRTPPREQYDRHSKRDDR